MAGRVGRATGPFPGPKAEPSGTIAIVPARMGSSRLPGKPLADIAGTPMVVRVLQGLEGSVDSAVAATDDKTVAEVVERAGYRAVLTGEAGSGTERVYSAWQSLGCPGKIIINVQGDEPMVCGHWISPLTASVPSDDRVYTIARRVSTEEASGADTVKVALTGEGDALYFSRYPIPHGSGTVLEHVGIYAFSPASLQACARCGDTLLSRTERLEQLAWMETGIRIGVHVGDFRGTGVDTPEDLERAVAFFREKHGESRNREGGKA